MKTSRDLNKMLFQTAEPQQGLFTAQQAEEAGYLRTNHVYHVKKGDWIREERGIYRLALFPQTRDQQRTTYALWSRNRDGEIQGVYSHETALAYYELSDVNPSKLHLTVPKEFRRNADTPRVLVLHRADLSKSDISQGPGYLVTTPIRTLCDILVDRTISLDLVEQAIRQALDRGLVTGSELKGSIKNLQLASTSSPRNAKSRHSD